MYVQRNMEARSRYYCWYGKARNITHSDSVFVALGIQHTRCHLWLLSETFLFLRNERDITINVRRSSCKVSLTFIGPCIANIIAEYNQQDATFHNLSISVGRSTCFRRFFRPSSGAQNCTHSVRYLSDQYCYLLLARPKHVEHPTEMNKLWYFISGWLYSANMQSGLYSCHTLMKFEFSQQIYEKY